MITIEDVVKQWGKKQSIAEECLWFNIRFSDCHEYIEADNKLKEMIKTLKSQEELNNN